MSGATATAAIYTAAATVVGGLAVQALTPKPQSPQAPNASAPAALPGAIPTANNSDVLAAQQKAQQQLQAQQGRASTILSDLAPTTDKLG